ncbi:MAG: hypothetical protein F6K10_07750 [Moorea sp. SIO2B7]|nr:hypothetical protein [Moorena sp. SIO2B7]
MSNNQEFDAEKFQEQVLKAVEIISFSERLDPDEVRPQSSGFRESKKEAEEMLKRNDIKQIICPALTTIAGEGVEFAKQITPVLVGAVLAGTITMPLTPFLFAWMALAIAKAGAATICADFKE